MSTPSDGSETIETGTDTVVAEISQGIGEIRLNRPERANALHPEMYGGVEAALRAIEASDRARVVVLTGTGTAFCSGGDVRDGRKRREGPAPTQAERAEALTHDARIVLALHECPKLTFASLPGAAVGAGLSLALSCDFRIAAQSAKLITGWARLAFSGDFGGTWLLTRMLGASKALELLASDRTVLADEARQLGLVNWVLPDTDYVKAAMALVARFANGPREAFRLMKENVRRAESESLRSALPQEASNMVASATTHDHREAVRAWLDKREPDFRAARPGE